MSGAGMSVGSVGVGTGAHLRFSLCGGARKSAGARWCVVGRHGRAGRCNGVSCFVSRPKAKELRDFFF